MSPDELRTVAQIIRERTPAPRDEQPFQEYYSNEITYKFSFALDELAYRIEHNGEGANG